MAISANDAATLRAILQTETGSNALAQYLGEIADGNTPLLGLASTAAEIDAVADVSGRVQQLTASGAVTAGVQSIELSHASVIIAATIASLAAHQGFLMVKNTSASGTAAHKVTVTTGTWNGTNKILTLNAPNEAVLVYVDSAGNGTIIENVGAVGISGT